MKVHAFFFYLIFSVYQIVSSVSSDLIKSTSNSSLQCYGSTQNRKKQAQLIVSEVEYDPEEDHVKIMAKVEELEKITRVMKLKASLVKTPMYNKNIIYYMDIFQALESGVIGKVGSPNWNESSFKEEGPKDLKLIGIGMGTEDKGHGMGVKVPEGYDILWIMCGNTAVNDEVGFDVYSEKDIDKDEDEESFKMITARNWRNEVSPDGSLSGYGWQYNKWFPFPLYKRGVHILSSHSVSYEGMTWVAALAFGKNNYWNSVYINSLTLANAINGGETVKRHPNVWYNENYVYLYGKIVRKIYVPVISNGKDKLLFFVLRNDNVDVGITKILVNDVLVERLTTNYFNSYSRHHNSRPFGLYVASKVPASLIPKGARFINVTVDNTNSEEDEDGFHIRKVGTHDFYPNAE